MDPMQKLERAIKTLVGMILLAFALLIGMRVMASRSFSVSDPAKACLAQNRQWDAQRSVCLAPR